MDNNRYDSHRPRKRVSRQTLRRRQLTALAVIALLVLLFVLLDSRHDLQKIDLEFLQMLGEEGVPFAIIYTKCDKSGATALEAQLTKNNAGLMEYWEELPPVFRSSSKDGTGREEILDYIGSVLKIL